MNIPAEARLLEEKICALLGIPPEAKQVIILSQSSHLDWDWLLPFPILVNNVPPEQINYFKEGPHTWPVSAIFSAAAECLCPNGQPNPLYYYSICEIGFLRAFAEQYPTQFAQLKAAGDNLRIVGGGITSPDSLLPHGEAFIRNYLLGKLWVGANLGLPLTQAWMPDDFGHDPQLPVLLEALGLGGVGFQRVPMTFPYPEGMSPLDGTPSISKQLSGAGGADFIWQAADGSTTVAHWLQGGYCQGDDIDTGPSLPNVCIQNYYNTNSSSSATRYIFVPVGCDFTRPRDLPTYAAEWNQEPSTEPGYASTGAYAVAATFDHYIQLLQLVNSYQPLKQRSFYAVPYMTGCYATRPLLKQEHYAATRALLGAEVFSVISGGRLRAQAGTWQDYTRARVAALDSCWNDLVPSTHHDYISGTGFSSVYDGEQVPLLRRARAGSESLRQTALAEIAGAVGATPYNGEVPVVVCNQLGFATGGLVRLEPDIALSSLGLWAAGVRAGAGGDSSFGALQYTADSAILFQATAPSLGYSTYYISKNGGNDAQGDTVSLTQPSGGTSAFVLANSYLSATISQAANWAVTELCDLKSSDPAANILSGPANALSIYQDGGNNYRFGNEFDEDSCGSLLRQPENFTNPSVEVLETGPLRVRVRTRITYVEPTTQNAYVYTREYILHAGEPFLRMKTTGAAPFGGSVGYSVMVEFPLQQDIQKLAHGTTYHWDDQPQVRYWDCPAFQATHDYVIAIGAGGALGAIYHGGVPAWGQTTVSDIAGRTCTLMGCLLRNTTGSYFDWVPLPQPSSGIDPEEHTLEYAFRVPTGMGDPASGMPLRESLAFQTPLMAAALPAQTTRTLPDSFSLAEVSSDGANQPLLTVAKFGSAAPTSLILRVYQATNSSLPVDISLAGWASLHTAGPGPEPPAPLQVRHVTALEAESEALAQVNATANGGYNFVATRALTTLQVT